MSKWSAALVFAALLSPTACDAKDASYLRLGTVSVPFDGMRSHADPNEPYRDLVQRLKETAASEARDRGTEPVTSTRPWGPRGERLLISAITPRKGVFYLTRYGAHGSENELPGRSAVIIRRRDHMDVCRFTIEWDKLPGGAYAPGLLWASWAFPSIECAPPSSAGLARFAEQRHQSERASYKIEAVGSAAGIKATVVGETWPTNSSQSPPPDAGRAIAAAIGNRRAFERIIPLTDEARAYAVTKDGASVVALADPHEFGLPRTICVVKGLSWSEIARGELQHPMKAAKQLCERLFAHAREERLKQLERDFRKSPPVMTSIPPAHGQ